MILDNSGRSRKERYITIRWQKITKRTHMTIYRLLHHVIVSWNLLQGQQVYSLFPVLLKLALSIQWKEQAPCLEAYICFQLLCSWPRLHYWAELPQMYLHDVHCLRLIGHPSILHCAYCSHKWQYPILHQLFYNKQRDYTHLCWNIAKYPFSTKFQRRISQTTQHQSYSTL